MEKRLVHLVDDEESIRRSASFLLKTSGFEVRTYASGVEFLKAVRHARGVALPVIVQTGHGDVTTAVQAMKAGAVDFLEKPFEKATLLAALDRACRRLDHSEEAADAQQQAEVRIAALTPREREVLRGLVRGHPNKTLAYDLGISPRTVEVHRANVMSKLNVRSLSEALRIAFAAGLSGDDGESS